MTCTETTDRLDEYVDGGLAGPALHEVELHLADCAECREEERLLRRLLAEAAALPDDVDLPHDLWPEIAARIQQEGRFKLLRGPWRVPLGLVAAAAVVTVVSVGWWAARPMAKTPAQVAGVPSARPVPVGLNTGVPADLVEAERGYAEATAQLMAALEKRRGELAPETMASVEENLRQIDVALAQVRAALRQDPDSRQLTRLLTSTHRRKLQTLQQVMRLSQKS